MEFIIHVVDQNDNKPVFTQSPFIGRVSDAAEKGTLNQCVVLRFLIKLISLLSIPVCARFHDLHYPLTIGFPFMTIRATDADDSLNTNNADIRYSIISQVPPEPKPDMFAINPISGVIQVNAKGLDFSVRAQTRFLII